MDTVRVREVHEPRGRNVLRREIARPLGRIPRLRGRVGAEIVGPQIVRLRARRHDALVVEEPEQRPVLDPRPERIPSCPGRRGQAAPAPASCSRPKGRGSRARSRGSATTSGSSSSRQRRLRHDARERAERPGERLPVRLHERDMSQLPPGRAALSYRCRCAPGSRRTSSAGGTLPTRFAIAANPRGSVLPSGQPMTART
jgi:hypothetical protein